MQKSNSTPMFILFISLFVASEIRGTNYYFSESTGNDTWTGTTPTPNGGNTDGPRRSLTALNTLLNTIAIPGDSIFLKRGDIWSGSIGIAANSAHGTSTNYILVGAYGTGNKPVINKTGLGEVLNCRGAANFSSSYLKFQNLTLTSSSPSGSRPTGINVNESFYTLKPHHIIFDSLKISGCLNGMVLYQQNITVENCLLEKNGNIGEGHGIFVRANDVIFRNNLMDSNGCGNFFVHTMYVSNCNNVLIEGNEISNADDGIKLRSSTNVVVRKNNIHDMYIHTIHLGGDDISGTSNITIEGNRISNSPQGLTIKSESGTQTLLSENITIKNNIFPAQVSIASTCPVKDIFIYNNLVYSSNNQNELFLFNSLNPVNVQIKNNIFYKTTTNPNHSLINMMASSGLNGVTIDHNLYYFSNTSGNIFRVGSNNYTTLSSFKTAFPTQELNGQLGNPNFTAAPTDFHLTPMSTLAIDKGADLSGIVNIDMDGNPRPLDGDGVNDSSWDIGPYEYIKPLLINKFDNRFEISVYPVPASQEITINTLTQTADKIVVTNISGKVFVELFPTSSQTQLSISNLNSGIYFMKVFLKAGVNTIKIIKLEE